MGQNFRNKPPIISDGTTKGTIEAYLKYRAFSDKQKLFLLDYYKKEIENMKLESKEKRKLKAVYDNIAKEIRERELIKKIIEAMDFSGEWLKSEVAKLMRESDEKRLAALLDALDIHRKRTLVGKLGEFGYLEKFVNEIDVYTLGKLVYQLNTSALDELVNNLSQSTANKLVETVLNMDVRNRLAEEFDNIHLDLFSSFLMKLQSRSANDLMRLLDQNTLAHFVHKLEDDEYRGELQLFVPMLDSEMMAKLAHAIRGDARSFAYKLEERTADRFVNALDEESLSNFIKELEESGGAEFFLEKLTDCEAKNKLIILLTKEKKTIPPILLVQ